MRRHFKKTKISSSRPATNVPPQAREISVCVTDVVVHTYGRHRRARFKSFFVGYVCRRTLDLLRAARAHKTHLSFSVCLQPRGGRPRRRPLLIGTAAVECLQAIRRLTPAVQPGAATHCRRTSGTRKGRPGPMVIRPLNWF